MPEARIYVFGATAVDGLGTAGGFKLMVEAAGNVDFDALQAQADELAAQGNRQPGLVGLFFSGFHRTPPALRGRGLSYLQKQSSQIEQFGDLQQNPFSAFALGVVLVFFVLAGLYESWSLPLAVILVVPCACSTAGGHRPGGDGREHLRAGRVRGIGGPGRQERHPDRGVRPRPAGGGATRFHAALEAARVRLRPILMTLFAFILGVFPLVIATGPARRCAARWARRFSPA